jgi:hypothetical protein
MASDSEIARGRSTNTLQKAPTQSSATTGLSVENDKIQCQKSCMAIVEAFDKGEYDFDNARDLIQEQLGNFDLVKNSLEYGKTLITYVRLLFDHEREQREAEGIGLAAGKDGIKSQVPSNQLPMEQSAQAPSMQRPTFFSSMVREAQTEIVETLTERLDARTQREVSEQLRNSKLSTDRHEREGTEAGSQKTPDSCQEHSFNPCRIRQKL